MINNLILQKLFMIKLLVTNVETLFRRIQQGNKLNNTFLCLKYFYTILLLFAKNSAQLVVLILKKHQLTNIPQSFSYSYCVSYCSRNNFENSNAFSHA